MLDLEGPVPLVDPQQGSSVVNCDVAQDICSVIQT
jgi:hypothetical protein